MPLSNPRHLPKYRHYKPKNLAVVRIDNRDFYLGRYGSSESWEKYHRLLAEHAAPAQPAPATTATEVAEGLTVNEVIAAYLTRHADRYYRRADGSPTGEMTNLRHALRPLKRLYGSSPAQEFGPKALAAVRQSMIDDGLCRNVINQRVGKIVRAFKWAVANELIPASVHHALKTVSGLRKGRSEARESGPVKPVPEAYVEAVRPHVSRQVRAMIELQLLTGMRPGEVTIMRTGDVSTSRFPWVYTPERHKTEHHGKERRIHLGPKAREVLRPWLRADPTAYLFQPREAVEELQAEKRRARKSPSTPSQQQRRRKTQPRRAPGEFYNTRAYSHAIHRACRKAGVPVWGPNRLRHNAATLLRKEFDLDTARAVLGQSDVTTTAIYAERDRDLAARAVERSG